MVQEKLRRAKKLARVRQNHSIRVGESFARRL
jgi:hypothetical protein